MRAFIDPPIVRASLAVAPVISVATRQARRLSGTLRCVKRLRPDWEEGDLLTKDCIDYIGITGIDDHRVYRLEDAAILNVHVEFAVNTTFDLSDFKWTAFDKIDKIGGETSPMYQRFTIKFFWWPHICTHECQPICALANECEQRFVQLGAWVMTLLPQTLIINHNCGYELHVGGHILLSSCYPELWPDKASGLKEVLQANSKRTQFDMMLWFNDVCFYKI